MSYYQQCDEPKSYRPMNLVNQQNSSYNYKKKKEYLMLSSSNFSSSLFTPTTNKLLSKKISNSNDDPSSFCHVMYITLKRNPITYPFHQSYKDPRFLLLPSICSTTLPSKSTILSMLTFNFFSLIMIDFNYIIVVVQDVSV